MNETKVTMLHFHGVATYWMVEEPGETRLVTRIYSFNWFEEPITIEELWNLPPEMYEEQDHGHTIWRKVSE